MALRIFQGYSNKKLLLFLYRRLFRIKQRIPTRLLLKNESINVSLSEFSSSMNYFLSYEEFKNYVLSSNNKDVIIKNADEILNNRLPILSEKTIDLGEEIKWDYDYTVGEHCGDLAEAKLKCCDIKRVWELSRLHQLTPLFKAYILTSDSKYLLKIKEIVNEWGNSNPLFEGPNWTNPMEISIRSANLINAIFLCPDLKRDVYWMGMLNQTLFWSGTYIRYHLENTTLVNNNHYISDLVGLIILSTYFDGTTNEIVKKETTRWREYAISELRSEVGTQILKDGGTYEKSTSYHAYILELFCVCCMVLKENTTTDVTFLEDAIRRMSTFILRLEHNDIIPFIGDSDNTRLFRFSDFYPFDSQKDYALLFNFIKRVFGIEKDSNNVFKDSGLYYLKDGKVDLAVNCGPMYACTGHCHNDQLAYVLWYNNELIVDDPGTYCYTSDKAKRDYFRSTARHTTITVNGSEQNLFEKCFEVKERTFSECLDYTENSFYGIHKGYVPDYGVYIERKITVTNDGIHVNDVASKDCDCVSRIVFSMEVEQESANVFKTKTHRFRIDNYNNDFKVTKDFYSPAYGQICKTIVLEFEFNKELNYSIIFES